MHESLIQLPASSLQHPVLLTGITGFIAGHLAERLLAEGIPVRGTARRPQHRPSRFRETSKVSPALRSSRPTCSIPPR